MEIRQDDVYQRLSPNFDVLYENEVLWNASCYATYTSEQNIKYVSNHQSSTVHNENVKYTEAASEPCAMISRSKAAPHDWSKCLFCKNRTHKKEKVMQSVSTLTACNTIMQCAEAKGDQDMLRVLMGVSNDLVAAEAKYHKTCFASYVSKSNLRSQVFKDDEGKESVYGDAFREMAFEIGTGLESGMAYDMVSLLKKYIELLEERGVDGQKYTSQKLKLRMKSHFGETIVFHQPYQRSRSELVYSSKISLQDIINASATHNKEQPSSQAIGTRNQTCNKDPPHKLLMYETAQLLKHQIKQCKGISIYPASVNDIDQATAKNLVPADLYLFLRWLITNDGVDVDAESDCSNDSDERKVLCLAQDVIHCTSHGRVKLPKHLGLAMSVRHLTATLVVYQQKPFGPMPPKEVLADHTKKKRPLTRVNGCDEILECSAHGKRPIVTDFLGQIGTESFHTTTDAYRSSCRMDLTWAIGRMSPTKLFDITEVTREEADQLVPSWSGFNSMLFPSTTQPIVIGYCPMINGSSTELNTVYTVMKKAQNICSSLQQRDMVITFDLAIYAKAKQIQWKFPEEFSDTVIRMGGFHIALNFLAVLGKKYQNSGLEDVLIESGAYGSGSVMALMKGKSYNQGVRAHKLAMEALFRLMWQSFLRWLGGGRLESQEQIVDKEHIADSIKSFRLAVQNRDHVPQSAEATTSELFALMELFEVFRHEQKSRSKMFDF